MSPAPGGPHGAHRPRLVRDDLPPADGGDPIVHHAVRCTLGWLLVAAGGSGVRAILLGDDPVALARDLAVLFPEADLREDPAGLDDLPARAVLQVEAPWRRAGIPVDMRGSDFRLRVWDALSDVRAGMTVTHAEIARRIGRPGAAREVGEACAANHLAVAVPCHRAVRAEGDASRYRWGADRRRELLLRERRAS